MPDDNRISASLAAEDITAIQGAIQTIMDKLPFRVSLTGEERMELPKMGDKSIGFDEKCESYIASNPEFLPGFIDTAEVDKDRALRGQMMQFVPQLQALLDDIDSTLMLVSSEVWMADLAYYQTVREAAKRGRAGADAIFNDLRQRFPGGSASPPPSPPPPSPPPPPPPPP